MKCLEVKSEMSSLQKACWYDGGKLKHQNVVVNNLRMKLPPSLWQRTNAYNNTFVTLFRWWCNLYVPLRWSCDWIFTVVDMSHSILVVFFTGLIDTFISLTHQFCFSLLEDVFKFVKWSQCDVCWLGSGITTTHHKWPPDVRATCILHGWGEYYWLQLTLFHAAVMLFREHRYRVPGLELTCMGTSLRGVKEKFLIPRDSIWPPRDKSL